MTGLDRDLLRACVAEARLAPSVHNIQPTRWRIAGRTIVALGDPARQLPVADPGGRDVMISHGAAIEGLDMAMRQRGLALGEPRRLTSVAPGPGGLIAIAELPVVSVPLAHATHTVGVLRRASWRGAFRPLDPDAEASLRWLTASSSDFTLVQGRQAIAAIAALGDAAGLHFLRDPAHRAELLAWMRLSKSDRNYHRDGLNCDAMNLGALEAWGAGLALGSLFATLDRVGIAGGLVSEAAKTRSAAAIALFHRPAGEDPLMTGRAFYRAWLAIDEAGMSACPMSVLVDWHEARTTLVERHPPPHGRQLVNVLRIGVPAGTPTVKRARLPIDELLV